MAGEGVAEERGGVSSEGMRESRPFQRAFIGPKTKSTRIGASGTKSESHNFRSAGGRLNIQDDRWMGRM